MNRSRSAHRRGAERYALALTPRAGLCNKLFVWARALTWADAVGAELLPTIWWQIRVGPILRGETDRKLYGNLFTPSSLIQVLRREYILGTRPHWRETGHMTFDTQQPGVYKFSGLRAHFRGLAASRPLIARELLAIACPGIRDSYLSAERPDVAVHIRRGDFVRNGMAVPTTWFIDAISAVRRAYIGDCTVTVFSDAPARQIEPVLSIEKVRMFSSGNSLVDLLVMSKARFLIATGTSSFGAWASFLGGVPSLAQQNASLANWGLNDADTPHLELTDGRDSRLQDILRQILTDRNAHTVE